MKCLGAWGCRCRAAPIHRPLPQSLHHHHQIPVRILHQKLALAEVILRNRLWNMMGAAGRALWATARKGTSGAINIMLKHDFAAFLLGEATLIAALLKLAQGEAAIWFPRLIEMLRGLGLPL